MIKKKIQEFLTVGTYGIKKASGKYIYFIDADDYIETNAFEDLINIMKINKPDLITTGYFSEIENSLNNSFIDNIYLEEKFFNNKEEIKQDFIKFWDKHILYNMWNKLYVKEIIDKYNIKFPTYNWGEDIKFNQDYLMHVQKLYNTSKCYYHYIRERVGAATKKYNSKLFEIRVSENEKFIRFFDEYGIKKEEYIEFISRRYLERTLGCIENLFDKECNFTIKEKYEKIKEIINHEETRKYLKIIKPNSKKIYIMLIPYRFKLYVLAMIMGKFLSIVKKQFPHIFNTLKNRR